MDNRLAELERRIAALESAAHVRGHGEPLLPGATAPGGSASGSSAFPSPSSSGATASEDDALEALSEREDWSTWAPALAALGNPVRLTLLREIVRGNNTVSALSEVPGLGTSGQIYHHLRQLTAEGWLHSPSRGIFALPPTRVVALLEILVALER